MAEARRLGLDRGRRWRSLLLLRLLRGRSIETGLLRQLLLVLVELRLELLGDSRHGRCAGLERLLLRSTSLKGLLLRSAGLEGKLMGSRLLAREAGELRLELARSLRLRLLNSREAGILVLERWRSLAEARRLRGEGARLLLLVLLLVAWLLPERGPELLRASGTHAIAATHE